MNFRGILSFIAVVTMASLATPSSALAAGCDEVFDSCLTDIKDDYRECRSECYDDGMACVQECMSGPAFDVTDCFSTCITEANSCLDTCRSDGYSAYAGCQMSEEACLECTDGSELVCDATPPQCEDGASPTVTDGCWECVDLQTCEAPCEGTDWWSIELESCCPQEVVTEQCVCDPGHQYVSSEVHDENGCLTDIACDCEAPDCDNSELDCDLAEPECGVGMVSAVLNGCWECVDALTCQIPCEEGEYFSGEFGACCPNEIVVEECSCAPGYTYVGGEAHDDSGCLTAIECECVAPDCNDGSDLTCSDAPPTCDDDLVLSIIDGCWACADAITCNVPCDPGTYFSQDLEACCPNEIVVEECACPAGWEYNSGEGYDPNGCLTTIECSCSPPDCSDDSELECDMEPPMCSGLDILSVRDGCWECVAPEQCNIF